jgi:hypothetical protein
MHLPHLGTNLTNFPQLKLALAFATISKQPFLFLHYYETGNLPIAASEVQKNGSPCNVGRNKNI